MDAQLTAATTARNAHRQAAATLGSIRPTQHQDAEFGDTSCLKGGDVRRHAKSAQTTTGSFLKEKNGDFR
jgi:hypothetical protein